MLAQDLYALLHARPFVPFRVHGTDGQHRDVRHPDEAVLGRGHVMLPIRGPGEVSERYEYLALAHVIRVEIPIASTNTSTPT